MQDTPDFSGAERNSVDAASADGTPKIRVFEMYRKNGSMFVLEGSNIQTALWDAGLHVEQLFEIDAARCKELAL
jgi:hypothetical protein